MFTRIEIHNFKSFDELSVNLDRFNVLVGANASGKSNFVQIFRFLQDIARHGLENALALQGDVKYFRNVKVPLTRNFRLSLRATFGLNEDQVFAYLKFVTNQIMIQPEVLDYSLEIRFTQKGKAFEVAEESLVVEYNFFKIIGHGEPHPLPKGRITVSAQNGKLHYQIELPSSVPLEENDIIPGYWQGKHLPEKSSLLEVFSGIPVVHLERVFSNLHIYDLDPKAMKKAVPVSGIKELEPDGSNIALVLKDLLTDKSKKKRFLSFMQDLLPFVQDLKVAKFADKSLHFSTQEEYTNQYLPGFLLSDGTVILTALIYALFFGTSKAMGEMPLVILEEPAQHIHPSLISRMLQLIEEASQSQQILITTHNPEIVKHTPLDRLLLISRDERGFSTIKRPVEKQEVKTFLENEIGIEELFLQNLLE